MLGKEFAPYVQIVKAQRPSFIRAEKKVVPYKTREETIRGLAENHQNVRNPETGRINPTGEYGGGAHTVCPYVPHYLDHVEDGIKPVVKALFEKGYLTISSCEGHGWGEQRYVTVAFPSEELRNDFKKSVGRVSWVELRDVPHMNNARVELYEDGSLKRVVKELDADALKKMWDGEIDYCNILFYRKYDFWCFLRIAIGPEWISFSAVTNWQLFVYRIKQAYCWITRKLFTGPSTRKITKILESKSFPNFLG